jgi:hypothetical protein
MMLTCEELSVVHPLLSAADAKVNPKAVATLLPNIKDREKGAEVFAIMSKNLHDDKQAFEFLCPVQVR